MSKAGLNKVRYQQFLKQARGADVRDVHVSRVERGKLVVLQYNARPKGRGRITAEWAIERGEDAAAVDNEVREVLGMFRKDFLVRRGEGLTGDAFADATQEAPIEQLKAANEE